VSSRIISINSGKKVGNKKKFPFNDINGSGSIKKRSEE
jgi:hypothetical protein